MDEEQIKTEISERWNESASRYDTFVSHGIHTDDEKKLWIHAFAKVLPEGNKPLSVLDVGCGTGAIGLIFAEMGHQVTGLDLSEKMMDEGRKKTKERALSMTFLHGDAENPPFPDNHFDVVINRHLLWTLPNPETALKSWKRIIKPGGRVIIIDGLWNDKRLKSLICRRCSEYLGRILYPDTAENLDYSPQLQQNLPHIGGISEAKAVIYFKNAGFEDIITENLMHIRKNQHHRLMWYQKIKPMGTYYLISGTKRA
ncbi:class I SAM-dependent methyltransferase [Methanospirillum hungatei]|uniref:class I SAM-dependent methyltransferase n=1 Tax=Methanospirillum hungatei TaxID=2203 RepID=UPI0026F07AAC|nr:methyltransferase domain-containing protein [Methanospirillum hungatei]MCA1916297.1 methyltransferase domain-containing protein [Methanospirillum hungatei]